MATAHGAGLMLVPVLLGMSSAAAGQAVHAGHGVAMAHSEHAGHLAATGVTASPWIIGVASVGIHTAAMFLVMAAIAIVVFEMVGLAILRQAWFNLDRIWAGALIGAGALTLVL